MDKSDDLRFLLIDDHPIFTEALQGAIRAAFPNASIVDAISLADAKSALSASSNFDLVLLDLSIPDTEGYYGLLELRNLHPSLPIVIVSGHEDVRIIRDVIAQGAAGFIPKSTSREQLTHAIAEVMDGNVYVPENYSMPDESDEASQKRLQMLEKLATLTPQQLRVTRMVRSGLLNKQIAYELGVGETTVKAHVSEVLRKLGVYSRTQVVIELNKVDDKDLVQFNLED